MPIKFSDANMLKYFLEEKGDITRYSKYPKLKDQLNLEYNLDFHLNAVKVAEQNLEMLLDRVVADSED